MFTKWKIRAVPVAILFIGFVAANCGKPTEPSVLSPDSWIIEPLQLQLAVGDTGQVRVVLLEGKDTLNVDARKNGAVTPCYQLCITPLHGGQQNGQVSRIVKRTYTAKIEINWIEAFAPGTETLGFYYGKGGPCPDPPECLGEKWVNLLPAQDVVITAQ